MPAYSNFFRSFLHFGTNQHRWKLVAIVSSVGLSTAGFLWHNQQHHYASSYSLQLKRYSASAEYPELAKHSNLMARQLTPQMYAKLRDRITPSGYTIDDVIQVGVDNPGVPSRQYFGVSAGDEETYKMFSDLFDPLIRIRYNYAPESRQYHDMDITKLHFPFESDNTFDINKYILSSRIRITRNLSGFTFPTFSTRAERRRVEGKLNNAFQQLIQNNQFTGNYYRLSAMEELVQEKLINSGIYLFKPQTMSWLSSGVARDWPDGRAIYVNDDKSIFAWINQKDHLRFISWSTNNARNNLRSVITKFFQGISLLENAMKTEGVSFAHDDHFGYLTTCPANVGTGLKFNVYLKLPNLTKDMRFPTIVRDLNLTMEEIMDPDAEAFKDCIDISNRDRIGKTEVEIIQQVLDGVSKLIEIERKLEGGNKLDEYLRR